MSKRKTQEEFEKEVIGLYGDEYTVLGQYINNQTKILIKHNVCGCENLKRPSDLLSGYRCFTCYGTPKKEPGENVKMKKLIDYSSRTKTTEQFKKEVYDIFGDEYSVLGTYINNSTKIKMRHNNSSCGNYEYETTPKCILRGRRCPKCFGTPKKTTEQYKKEVFALVGDEYSVLSEYKTNGDKILMRHNCDKCKNFEYEITPNAFLCGYRCAKCRGRHKTADEYREEFESAANGEYTLLSDYIDSNTKVRVKHNCKKCNDFEWNIRPYNFLNGVRCPKCIESKGEKKISKFLDSEKINYKAQYRIKDCKNKIPLPFDFAVFDKNGNLKFLIEFQGIQHYIKIDNFHKSTENFIDRFLYYDCEKRSYCEFNNIPLLEISYEDINKINNIVEECLIRYSLKEREVM